MWFLSIGSEGTRKFLGEKIIISEPDFENTSFERCGGEAILVIGWHESADPLVCGRIVSRSASIEPMRGRCLIAP